MIHKSRGLTLFEVLVVLGILAILAAFVAPNIVGWRTNMKLRGAANNLKGDLEMAKARAIRENNYVVIRFGNNGYDIFIDNGAGDDGVPGNWIPDGEEQILRDREMPTGVRIDLGDTTFSNERTRYSSRGHTTNGHTVLVNEKNEKIQVTLNQLGKITLEKL